MAGSSASDSDPPSDERVVRNKPFASDEPKRPPLKGGSLADALRKAGVVTQKPE